MSIMIRCPHCQARMRVKRFSSRGRYRCVKCRQVFQDGVVPNSRPGSPQSAPPQPAGQAADGQSSASAPPPPDPQASEVSAPAAPPLELPPPPPVCVPPAPPLGMAAETSPAEQTFLVPPVEEKEYFSETRLRAVQASLNRIYRLLVFALVVLGIAAAGSVACGVFLFVQGEKRSKELAKIHEHQRALFNEMRPKYGRVIVVVSWRYNKTIGHRPDVNSAVILFPKGLKGKLSRLPLILSDARGFMPEYSQRNVYTGWVGVDGRCVFGKVDPGEYWLLVISAATMSLTGTESLERQLSSYFSNPKLSGHQSVLLDVEVEAGVEIEINHDFGITEI